MNYRAVLRSTEFWVAVQYGALAATLVLTFLGLMP